MAGREQRDRPEQFAELERRERFAELGHLVQVHPDAWGKASDAAAQLARAREATLRERAAFRGIRPGPAENLSPLEHAEIDQAAARTAFYTALEDLVAGS